MDLGRSQSGKVLVVGGGGFIGSRVIRRLLQDRMEVVSIDVFKPPAADPAVDWVVGSANDEPLMAAVARGCSNVIFLAAHSLPATSNQDLAAEIAGHVRAVVKAAEICRDQDVTTFVLASSGGTVYDPRGDLPFHERSFVKPLSAYGASKMAIEAYLSILSSMSGMRTISLRLSNPFGPGQTGKRSQGFVAAAMAALVNENVLRCWGDGSIVRDFVFVDDVADAFRRCCSYTGASTVINIGSGVGRSLNDVVRSIEAVTGRKIAVEHTKQRSFDVPANVLDITLASETLGWKPEATFEGGLTETAKWWREHRNTGSMAVRA